MNIPVGQMVAGILVLATGTYLLRFGGVWLGSRAGRYSIRSDLLNDAATILLFSVAVLSAVEEAGQFAGVSRLIGVMAGALLVVCKRSLIEVVAVAALVTAGLRYLGLA